MAKCAEVLVEKLLDWGVSVVFGIPGDGINGIMEALRVHKDRIRFVQVRHEESAAFMACAYAKYTGRLGVCLATSGPGGIHLLNGLYDAKLDQAPVLAITGQTFSDLKGSRFQQEINMTLLYQDVAVYNQECINPEAIEMLTNEACRHALNHRGVAHLTIPVDYQEREVKEKTSMHRKGHAHQTSTRWSPPRLVPRDEDLRIAAFILNEAKKPVILAGQGCKGATQQLIQVAEKLGAPVVKALLGKEVLPDDHPHNLGGLGLLGTAPSETAMEGCDALLIAGSSFPYMEYLPKPGQARGIQIDDKPDRIGLRYPIEIGLVGKAKDTLEALAPLLQRKTDRSWLSSLQADMTEWWSLMKTRAERDNVPIKPQRVAWELDSLLDDDAIISTDSGTITTWVARYIRSRKNQKFSCSGTLATMACGLPYSIAAKVAFPDRQSVAFVGDGGFTMLMGDFLTACKYKLPIVVVIIKNNTLGQIKWEQIVFLGNPEYAVDLYNPSFARFAEACGGVGITVEKPEEIRPSLQRALAAGKPAIVEVVVDPFEPPMPARIQPQQALRFAQALARGEPNGPQIALTLFRDKLDELI